MSIEISWPFLIPCLSALAVLICVGVFIKHNTFHRILIIVVLSVTLPAFVPGHGELKVMLPNCALLGVPYDPPKVISMFYIMLYLYSLTAVFCLLKLLRFGSKRD